jgi:RHS repeat-associated protein
MPFGEELGSGVGGRTPGMGFSVSDGIRQKFTSKERDVETGLDYFGARYFASNQGRFTSPDPLSASARPENPKTWNRYVYVLNNPVRLIDPNGLEEVDTVQPQDEEQKKPQKKETKESQVVDLRKDKTIGAEIANINKTAVPLPPGQTPVLTNVKTVVGNTYNIENGGYIDAYGNEAVNFTGTVCAVGYIPLDQGGNIIEGNGIALTGQVRVKEGERPNTTNDLLPTPPGGVYLDVQSIKATSSKSVIEQIVWMGQFPRASNTPATSLFSIGINRVTKDPKAGTVSVTLGETKHVRKPK